MRGGNISYSVNLLPQQTKTAFTLMVLFNFSVTSLLWDRKHLSTEHIRIRRRGKRKAVQEQNNGSETRIKMCCDFCIHIVGVLCHKITVATSWAAFKMVAYGDVLFVPRENVTFPSWRGEEVRIRVTFEWQQSRTEWNLVLIISRSFEATPTMATVKTEIASDGCAAKYR